MISHAVSSDPVRAALLERIGQDFTYHPPVTQQAQALHEEVTLRTRALAEWMGMNLPVGRELSLALTELQLVRMWGNSAVAVGTARRGTQS